MNKVERSSALRAAVAAARKLKKSIAFVATMGNLHEGHLELVRVAKRRADFVVVSIFINPTQFGVNEDFDNYPYTPDEDAKILAEAGADLLFLPAQQTIYPGKLKQQTVVYVPEIGDKYCGQDRPEHFYGVTTVVSRLFNLVQPDIALFGKKDYQQLAIIRRLVRDLSYAVEIIGVDTVRNSDGLALSSRNGYLSEAQRQQASQLYATLNWMSQQIALLVFDKQTAKTLCKQAMQRLEQAGFTPQYVEICRQSDLKRAKKSDKRLVILAAARIGTARLIDNIEIERD